MRTSQLSVAVVLWLLLAACGKSPATPSSSGQSGSAPPAGATLTAVQVTGPARLAPGEMATYLAIATYSDGSARDVSANATWNPNTPGAVLYFTAPGIAVGVRPGAANVIARVAQTQASLSVVVLEKGTFKLSGRIVETGDRPLEGLSIDVVSGTGVGLRATANSLGEYALYGVAGPTQLRVSGNGFTPQVRDLVVTADTIAENFVLAPREPPAPGIAGDWTMTLTPSPTCTAAPLDIARGRRYQVQIQQRGTGLSYVLSGPTVTAVNQQFNTGLLFGAHLTLYFVGDTDYGDWSTGDITDHLSASEIMQFNGTLEGDLKDSTITAAMRGDIMYWDRSRTSFAPNWYCRATDHAVVLRK
jgi:hypothetical protein